MKAQRAEKKKAPRVRWLAGILPGSPPVVFFDYPPEIGRKSLCCCLMCLVHKRFLPRLCLLRHGESLVNCVRRTLRISSGRTFKT